VPKEKLIEKLFTRDYDQKELQIRELHRILNHREWVHKTKVAIFGLLGLLLLAIIMVL